MSQAGQRGGGGGQGGQAGATSLLGLSSEDGRVWLPGEGLLHTITGWLGRREGLQIAWVLWEPPLGDWPLDEHFLKEACI